MITSMLCSLYEFLKPIIFKNPMLAACAGTAVVSLTLLHSALQMITGDEISKQLKRGLMHIAEITPLNLRVVRPFLLFGARLFS